MKSKTKLLAAVVVLMAAGALGQVPGKLGYSGRLLKTSGAPETGMVSLKFTVYDSASGGSNLWSETQSLVLSADGTYSTFLGEVSSIPTSVFEASGSKYLEIQVNGGTPLTPRQPINSVPYALVARSVKGGTVDATALKVNGTDLISNGKLAGQFGYQAGAGISIDGNNQISLVGGCSNGQVLAWSGGTWACSNASGPQGVTGPQGLTGATGPTGPQGPAGSAPTYTAGAGLTLTGSQFAAGPELLNYGLGGANTADRTDVGASGAGAQSGFFQTSAPAPAANWYPGAAGWQHFIDVRHTNAANNFAMQFAGGFYDQNLWFRKTANNPAQAWRSVVTVPGCTAGQVPEWDGTQWVCSPEQCITVQLNNRVDGVNWKYGRFVLPFDCSPAFVTSNGGTTAPTTWGCSIEMHAEHHSGNVAGVWKGRRSANFDIWWNGDNSGAYYLEMWDYSNANVFNISSGPGENLLSPHWHDVCRFTDSYYNGTSWAQASKRSPAGWNDLGIQAYPYTLCTIRICEIRKDPGTFSIAERMAGPTTN